MPRSFYRFNTADQDKKLAADVIERDGLELYRLVVKPDSVESIAWDGTYFGKAAPGSALDAPVWFIQKLLRSPITRLIQANGEEKYDQVWDDRASLTYS